MLTERTWTGRALGTGVKLQVVTDDVRAGDDALLRAVKDLEETEQALSRFREDSDLSILNREGTTLAGWRLFEAVEASIRAYEWSGGIVDPRVIQALENLGYRKSLPRGDVRDAVSIEPLGPADMRNWVDTGELDAGERRISLPESVRLDLAGVGKALGIGWAARHLAGHAGLLVDVGGDVMAIGCDGRGEPWRIAVYHGGIVGEFTGSPLAVATSTTMRRAWKAAGRNVHHLIDPRTGEPSRSGLLYATVAAPTILESDLIAKMLVIKGKEATHRIDGRYQAIVTSESGETRMLGPRENLGVTA